jgi:hypothetical protein
MKQKLFYTALFLIPALLNFSCKKENVQSAGEEISKPASPALALRTAAPPFNLEVVLRGAGKSFGLVKFRQDNDVDKIVALDTWVRGLLPDHAYRLQRAVDMINVVDGNCTSTTWLTLGTGLTAHDIVTDSDGTGTADLWRSVASVPTGSMFDIHFQVIDAATMAVVLTSDCYQYSVR